jgi:hypothetical protein
MPVEPALEVEGQRLHLGQLRHAPSLVAPAVIRWSRRSLRLRWSRCELASLETTTIRYPRRRAESLSNHFLETGPISGG